MLTRSSGDMAKRLRAENIQVKVVESIAVSVEFSIVKYPFPVNGPLALRFRAASWDLEEDTGLIFNIQEIIQLLIPLLAIFVPLLLIPRVVDDRFSARGKIKQSQSRWIQVGTVRPTIDAMRIEEACPRLTMNAHPRVVNMNVLVV